MGYYVCCAILQSDCHGFGGNVTYFHYKFIFGFSPLHVLTLGRIVSFMRILISTGSQGKSSFLELYGTLYNGVHRPQINKT